VTDLHESEEMSWWKSGVLLHDQLVDVRRLVVSFRARASAGSSAILVSFVPENRKKKSKLLEGLDHSDYFAEEFKFREGLS